MKRARPPPVLVEEIDAWSRCGPLPLTDLTRQVLLDSGVPEEAVHRELFHVGPPVDRAAIAASGPGGMAGGLWGGGGGTAGAPGCHGPWFGTPGQPMTGPANANGPMIGKPGLAADSSPGMSTPNCVAVRSIFTTARPTTLRAIAASTIQPARVK